jgi:hypothetical protein
MMGGDLAVYCIAYGYNGYNGYNRVCELRKHFSFLFTPFFEDFSATQPFLLQQVNNQLVHDFLSQQNNRLFLFLSELMDLFVAGRDQSAADQPNNLAEGHPQL